MGMRLAVRALTSPRTALALLLVVLGCALVGVTLVRGQRAWELIYSTFWFNGLLVLVAISSGAAFFGRIWRRRLTLHAVGMLLFHLSFLVLLGSVVVNGLLRFQGVLRLTEGETLSMEDPASFDSIEEGRLFSFDRLRGAATLKKVHTGYKAGGLDKKVAYEIEVESDGRSVTGISYVTNDFKHEGVRFLRLKEGYSVLVMLTQRDGTEVYGAFVPLQSYMQPDGRYVYATGSAKGGASFPFPPPPEEARADLLVAFRPNSVEPRSGSVTFEVASVESGADGKVSSSTVPVGGAVEVGLYRLEAREVRFWAGIEVRYDPAMPAILGSLCLGLVGMFMTLVARMRQGAKGA